MLALIRRVGTEFGINVLLSSHLLDEVERVCDSAVILARRAGSRRRLARRAARPASAGGTSRSTARPTRWPRRCDATGATCTADGRAAARRAGSTTARRGARRASPTSAWRSAGSSAAGSASRTCSSRPGMLRMTALAGDARDHRPRLPPATTGRASAPAAPCAASCATPSSGSWACAGRPGTRSCRSLSLAIAYVPAIVFVGIAALIKDAARAGDGFLPTYGRVLRLHRVGAHRVRVVRRPRGAVPRPPHRHARALPGVAADPARPTSSPRSAPCSACSPWSPRPAAAHADRLRAAGPGPDGPLGVLDAAGRGRRRRACSSPPSTPSVSLGISSLTDRRAIASGGARCSHRRHRRRHRRARERRRPARVAARLRPHRRRRSSWCSGIYGETASCGHADRRARRRQPRLDRARCCADLVALPPHRGDEVSAVPPPTVPASLR